MIDPRRRSRALGPSFVAALLLATLGPSCSGGGGPAAPPADAKPIDPATVGVVAGTVSLEGPAPTESPIDMSIQGDCSRLHETPPFPGAVLVQNGKLRNAVVYVASGLGSWRYDPPGGSVLVDQVGCLFEPRVVAVRTGQKVILANSDKTEHNVRSRPETNRAFNVLLQTKGIKKTKTFDEPEIGVRLTCDIHPWMNAYASAFDHPYFAVTGPDGSFEISNLPAGTYEVAVWHERLAGARATVTVEAGKTARLDLALRPPA